MPPKLLDYQPVFDAALPSEWELIGRSRGGLGGHGEPVDGMQGGCFVLAHPTAGVALVDLLPNRTLNAEALFRRLLNAVDFSARCRGYLPVIHVAVGPDELPALLGRIEDGFGYDSVLTIADRGQWVGELWRVLQAGITWEALGRPPSGRIPPALSVGGERWALPARLARASLLAGGLFGLFGLGFAAALLLPPPAEAPPQPATSGLSALAAVTPRPATLLAPLSAPMVTPAPDVGPSPAPALAASMTSTLVVDPLPMVASAAPQASADEIILDPAEPQAETQAETRTVALAPGTRRNGRAPLPIDRRCSEALFRFQQGGSLSSQEMTYVRQGCASWR